MRNLVLIAGLIVAIYSCNLHIEKNDIVKDSTLKNKIIQDKNV